MFSLCVDRSFVPSAEEGTIFLSSSGKVSGKNTHISTSVDGKFGEDMRLAHWQMD